MNLPTPVAVALLLALGCAPLPPLVRPPPGVAAEVAAEDAWPEVVPEGDRTLGPADPVALTRAVLAAARRGDGAAIVAMLHPSLRAVWSRRGRLSGTDAAGYAARRLDRRTLAALGPVTKLEHEPRRGRCEVEVRFLRKMRDVDFVFLPTPAGWRLAAIEDYP